MTGIEEDQAIITRIAGDLASLAGRARAKLTGPDGHTPSLHRIVAKLNYDWKHPPFEASPLDFAYSLFHLGADALEAGEDIMNYLCGIHESAPGPRDINLPFAVSAIDFEGSNEGWPRVTEMPFVNGFVIVPESLHDDFKQRLVTVEALDFESHSRVRSILGLEVQEIELSDLGLAMAVRHVLRFARTLPSKLFPGEANAICYANYPEE